MISDPIRTQPETTKKVTCKDVAEIAGVTHTTVSRVLNNSGYVSVETRRLVLDAVKKIGYKPLSAARMLASQRTETIGLLTESKPNDDENSYRSSFLSGASLAITEIGYRMAMATTSVSASLHEIAHLPIFERRCMDGVILDLHRVQCDYEELVKELGLPYIFVNSPRPIMTNAVIPDDFGVADQATSYLIQHGHTRIGYMPKAASFIHGSQFDRMKGHGQAMAKYNLPCVPMWDIPLQLDKDSDDLDEIAYRKSVRNRLEFYFKECGCTAVVAYDTRIASRVLVTATEMGLKVPDDFSMIACDYEPFIRFHLIPVTAFKLDRMEMAKIAVDLLVHNIETGGNANSVFVKGKLVNGLSVRPNK